MLAHRLSPQHYQQLVDQGWRRSGRFLYRPANSRTCCPQYTVRLDALAFAPDREQRRTMARMARFLETGSVSAAAAAVEVGGGGGGSGGNQGPCAMDEDGDGGAPQQQESSELLQAHLQRALQHALAAVLLLSSSSAASPPPALPAARVLPLAPHSHGSRAAPKGTVFTSPSVLAVVAALQSKQPRAPKKQQQQGDEAAAAATATAAATTPKKRQRGGAGGAGGAGAGCGSPTSLSSPRLDPGEVAVRVAAVLNGGESAGGGGGDNNLAALPAGLCAVAAPTGHLNFVREEVGEGGMEERRQKDKQPASRQHQQRRSSAAAAIDAAPPPSPPSSRHHRLYRLVVETVPSTFDEESFALYVRYQASQHGDDPDSLTRDSYRRFLVDTPLFYARPAEGGGGGAGAGAATPATAGQQQPSSFTSERGYAADDAQAFAPAPRGYGSYHQRYRLVPVSDDDSASKGGGGSAQQAAATKLVAVAVVDVLPGCLSSVYVFWDPDYAHLGLGRYTALREIEWVRRGLLFPNAAVVAAAAAAGGGGGSGASAAATHPPPPAFHPLNPRHYYLGYYIHSCHKMRYKGDYAPSELLCHETGAWVPLTDAARRAIEGGAAAGGAGGGDGGSSSPLYQYVALGRVPALAAVASPNPEWSLTVPAVAREPAGAAVPQASVDAQLVVLPGGGGGGRGSGGALRVARWASVRALLMRAGVDAASVERRLREWIAHVGVGTAAGMAEMMGELRGGGGGGGGGGGDGDSDEEEEDDDEEE